MLSGTFLHRLQITVKQGNLFPIQPYNTSDGYIGLYTAPFNKNQYGNSRNHPTTNDAIRKNDD